MRNPVKMLAPLLIGLAVATSLAAAVQIPAELRKAIQLRGDAVARKDSGTWDRLTTADFTTVLEDGRLQTKAERLSQLKGEKSEPPTNPVEERFSRYGNTVIHRTHWQDGSWVMTVWVKDGSNWRAAAVQVTSASQKK